MTKNSATYLTELHQLLNEYFNLEEIRTLCFNLNVDYESVAGDEKPARIRELLLGLGRNGRLPNLLTRLQQDRPHVEWPPLPNDFELPEALVGETVVSDNQYHIYGDHITVGNITNAKAIAVGRGASVTYQEGLSVEEVAALVVELKNQDQPEVWNGDYPYLGLTAFQESDAKSFFGRESLVDELLERVGNSLSPQRNGGRFITIAGPSGSGKSSVARAGLFYALREGRLEKSNTWLLATMQPKGDPIEQLAQAMERSTKSTQVGDEIRAEGARNPALLHRLIEMHLSDDPRQRCVLLVDQFEETFTQTKDDAQRAAFIDLLTTAAQVDNGRVIILLSLRSDFISHCARYPNLRSLMSQQFQLVGAMDPPDLAKAITLPALEVGAKIDPELVSRIMADMKGEPGALPLMSFALRDLFDAEKSAKGEPMDLLLPEYVARGGIESALERHANKVFDNFTDEQKGLARGVFSKLIEVGQGRADTRRTAALNELIPAGTEQEAVKSVIDALAKEGVRLITTSGGETAVGGGESVTIAHEKLIDAWPWLRQLVDENRDMIILQNQISADAQDWVQKEDAGYLYRGGRLIQVEEQLAASTPDLNELSQQFIQASLDQRQKEIEEKEAIQRRELEQAQELAKAEQKRSILFRRALIGGGVLALFLLVAMIFAGIQANIANDSLDVVSTKEIEAANEASTARAAEATATVAQGEAEIRRNEASASAATAQYSEAVALTREAEALAAVTAEAIALADARDQTNIAQEQAAVAQSRSLATSSLAVGHENDMRALLLAIAAGQQADTSQAFNSLFTQLPFMPPLLQTLSHDGSIEGTVWDEDESQILHSSSIEGAVWNEDESQILTWSKDWTVTLWDAVNGDLIQTLLHEDIVRGAVWNEDESQILTWSDDSTVRLWDAASGAPLRILSHEDTVRGAAWNQDEGQILTWSNDGMAKLWNATSGDPLLTLSHDRLIEGAAWNEDENQILTWSFDGMVKLWNATSGELIQTLSHEEWVLGAAWNVDESQILSWSGDGTAKLWDAASGAPLQTLSHGDTVRGAVWNDDESHIMTWGDNGTVKLWDAASSELKRTLSHDGHIFGVAWNDDESHIITWGDNGTAKLWDTASGAPLRTLSHEDTVIGAVWNDDESHIMTWSVDGTAKLWDTASGELIQALSHDGWAVNGAAWNDDESHIMTWSFDGTAKLWDVANEQPLQIQILSHGDIVFGAVWNEDESQILSWSGDGTAKLWDVTSGDPLLTLSHDWDVIGAAWNQNESYILTWSRDGTAKLWDAASGEPLQTMSHEGWVLGAAWNQDENLILSWSGDGMVKLWDAASGEPLLTMSHDWGVLGAAWNQGESLILTWSDDGMVKLWDVISGESLLTLSHEGWKVNGAAWNQDENLILSWSGDGTAKLWDAASGEPLLTMLHDWGVLGAAWNQDESLILTWSDAGTAKVWDAVSGDPLQTLSHEGVVNGAVWNQDESHILTWSWDGTAKVWDVQTGHALLILNPDGTSIFDARWNQDEDRLLIATEGGIVSIYYTKMDDLLEVACQLSTRNFSWVEWQVYFPGVAYRRTCAQWPSGVGAPADALLWGE